MSIRVCIVADCAGPEAIEAMLSAATALNALCLSRNPGIPPLYDSGVRYRREKDLCVEGRDVCSSEERFNTVPTVMRIGFGDCDDLACWRAAELRVRERIAAVPKLIQVSTVPPRYHVIVVHPDGSTEDPSEILGMGSHS